MPKPYSSKPYFFSALAAFTLVAAGCPGATPGDDSRPEPLPLTTGLVRDTAKANLTSHLNDLEGAFRSLSTTDSPYLSPTESASVADAVSAQRPFAIQLAESLFDENSVVHLSDTQITYRLRAERVCSSHDRDSGALSAIDPQCANLLNQLPIELSVTSFAAGALDVAVAVGSTNPAVLRLDSSRFSVELELDESRRALEQIAAAQGAEPVAQLGTVAGRVAFTFSSEQDRVRLALSILEDVMLSHLGADGESTLKLGVTDALAAIQIDSIEASVELESEFPGLDVSAYAGLVSQMTDRGDSIPPLPGKVSVHLPAMALLARMSTQDDALRIRALGLGTDTARVAYEGVVLAEASLTPMDGSELSVSVRPYARGTEIAATPGVKGVLKLDLRTLPVENTEMLPQWLLHETFVAELAGATQPALGIPADSNSDVVVELLSGLLTLGADGAGSVTVPHGSCLRQAPDNGEASHPLHLLQSSYCD